MSAPVRSQFKDASGTGTTLAVTPTTGPAAGNFAVIIVEYSSSTSSVSSISQTNATWTRATQANNPSGAISLEIWTSTVPASPGTTITVNFSASRTAKLTYVEITGTSVVIDQTASWTDNSTLMGTSYPATGLTGTTTANDEYLLGSVAFDGNDADITGHTNSFVEFTEGGSSPDYTVADRTVSATGTFEFNTNTLGLSPTWYSAGAIITLKETITAATRRNGGSFM